MDRRKREQNWFKSILQIPQISRDLIFLSAPVCGICGIRFNL